MSKNDDGSQLSSVGVYSDTPSDCVKKRQARRKLTDLTFLPGLVVGKENKLTEVLWGGPAYSAGLTAGTQINPTA